MMDGIRVQAERWEALAAANSCHLAIGHKGNKPVPVRVAEYGGFLYTVFATITGPYGGAVPPHVEAYRLVPPSLYAGETTLVYHDEEAIQSGRRKRGDKTGLIVAVNGKTMVCAQVVRFVLDLPGTRPLPLAEAKDYDARHRRSGWRALWFAGKEPEWFSLRGHPVAVYRDHATLGTNHAVLIWRASGEIRELSIDGRIVLSPPEEEFQTAPSSVEEGQLVLF